ncbi:MAG: ATP-binding protein [Bacteroidales bacterium]|nr:ATP-binding protein [Bacteroidales bacterium]
MVTKISINKTDTEKLIEENLALKNMLRRYLLFGEPNKINNLDNDLSTQLNYVENAYSTLFDSLLTPAFAGDILFDNQEKAYNYIFTQVNQKFIDFVKQPPQFIIGRTAAENNLICNEAWIKCFANVATSQIPFKGVINDSENVYDVSVFSIKKNSFIAIFQPSNSKSNAENKIRQNLRFTQMMLDAIPTPVFYKDMEGRYVLCNKSYAKNILGVSPDTILGKTALQLEDFFPKEYADFYQEKDIELIKKKGIQSYEGHIKEADGNIHDYIVNKTLIKNDKNEFVGILGVMQNIDKLIKTSKDLAESEIRYKILFNGIRQPIIVVDTVGNVIEFNSASVELFEQDINNIISHNETFPALQIVDLPLIKSILESGLTQTRKLKIKVQGQDRWYLATMQPINDFFGEKVVQIICNDITEIKHYQTELLGQKRKAEESNNLKTVFLANIAHETRTPANIISGFVQLIQSGLATDKHKDYLNLIYSNCKKLLDIIDDIVELSMIETGQIKIRHEICSVNSIVEEAFAFLQDFNKESCKNIKLLKSKPIDDYDSLVYADTVCINQIFKKLITNAVTFTENGEIEIGVYILNNQVYNNKLFSPKLCFYVRDTGIGIPDDKINVIFERFRQADEGASRQYGGNGLGLSIANELVKRMGGLIQVNSIINQGSTFTFSIPYNKAEL